MTDKKMDSKVAHLGQAILDLCAGQSVEIANAALMNVVAIHYAGIHKQIDSTAEEAQVMFDDQMPVMRIMIARVWDRMETKSGDPNVLN